MARPDLSTRVALITGASSGIGKALVREYARCGAAVVLCARREDRIEGLAEEIRTGNGRAVAVPCDVRDLDNLETATAAALENWGRLDHVVANAGFAVGGRFASLDIDAFRRQFETNVHGVVRTVMASRTALAESAGHLVIVGSVTGYIALPGAAPYCMSKSAVHALAAALRPELAEQGIATTLVVPGLVDSEIRRVNNDGVFEAERAEPIPRRMRMRADVAARRIVRAAVRGRTEVVITGHGKLLVFVARHAPWLLRALISRFNVRAGKHRG